MNIPNSLKYTENDEWLKLEATAGTVGISEYAQDQLSDIVFVEIVVAVGESVTAGDTIATIESVKAAADVYAPVSGTITAVNDDLPDTPELVNSDPYGEAWLVKLTLSNPDETNTLLDAEGYQHYLESRE